MTNKGQKMVEHLVDLPLDDLVTLHSEVTSAIYEREDSEGVDPDFWAEIQERAKKVASGTAHGVEAFSALAKM